MSGIIHIQSSTTVKQIASSKWILSVENRMKLTKHISYIKKIRPDQWVDDEDWGIHLRQRIEHNWLLFVKNPKG